MTYVAEHADALEMVREAGAECEFVHESSGTYNKAAGTWSNPTTETIEGVAIEDEGSIERYKELGLTSSQALTLLFVPTTMGQLPGPQHKVAWGGETLQVRDVKRLAPAGTSILASIVVVR